MFRQVVVIFVFSVSRVKLVGFARENFLPVGRGPRGEFVDVCLIANSWGPSRVSPYMAIYKSTIEFRFTL